MKVDDLKRIELDLWVAKAEGLNPKIVEGTGPHFYGSPMPSWIAHQEGAEIFIDWDFIGPIMERDRLDIIYGSRKTPTLSGASKGGLGYGDTGIDAVKRCIVKRKYGETVEVVTPREDVQ